MPRRHASTLLGLLLLVLLVFIYCSFPADSSKLSVNDLSPTYKEQGSESKHIVAASMRSNDTSWIRRRLPEWTSSVYVADDPDASYAVPKNKGREAMVYLTYLIENYEDLPDIMVFIHGPQYQWHNDDPNYDGATIISRLQLSYVQSEGYVNLRCVWDLGCPIEIHVRNPTSSGPLELLYGLAFREIFPDREVPDQVGASCCAQFALTRHQARKVSRKDYLRIRQWLIETKLDDEVSGRIMEYSWHMLFGRGAMHCPDAKTCYCKVFGLCELEGCSQGDCGRYLKPPQSNQPPWWKEDPVLASGSRDEY